MAVRNTVRQRIAAINGVGPQMLTEGSTLKPMVDTLRNIRMQVNRIGENNAKAHSLNRAVIALDNAIAGIEDYLERVSV